MLYELARFVAGVAAKIAFDLRTEGRENIPVKGGIIVASNHQTYWDPVFLVIYIKHRFRFMAKEELFEKNKAFGWLIAHLGAFRVARGKGDTAAIDTAVDAVRQGQDLLIFPEGHRSKDGALQRIRSGASVVASKTGAPILPVAICYEGRLTFRKRVTLRYGELIYPEERDGNTGTPSSIRRINRELGERIGALMEGTL